MNEVLIRYLSDVFNTVMFVSGLASFASFVLVFVFMISNCFIDRTMTWRDALQDSTFRFLCAVLFICLIIFIFTPQDFKHYFNLI